MKKLILKTALITLGTIVAVLCILYGVMSLCFPLAGATFFDNLGMQDAAVSFYELQYENTKDINDLGVLCVKVSETEDSIRAKKYITLLTESEGYSDYLTEFDGKNNGAITGEEYFNGKLAIAIQKSSGVEEFIEFALSSVQDEYNEFNCFYLALSVSDLFSEEDLILVRKSLHSLEEGLSAKEITYLNRDLEFTEIAIIE